MPYTYLYYMNGYATMMCISKMFIQHTYTLYSFTQITSFDINNTSITKWLLNLTKSFIIKNHPQDSV